MRLMTIPLPSRSISALAAVVISSALSDCQGDTAELEGVASGAPSEEQAAKNDSNNDKQTGGNAREASFVDLLVTVIWSPLLFAYSFEHCVLPLYRIT